METVAKSAMDDYLKSLRLLVYVPARQFPALQLFSSPRMPNLASLVSALVSDALV